MITFRSNPFKFFILTLVVLFHACKKEDVLSDLIDEDVVSNSVVPSYVFKSADANAVFLALNAVTYKDVAVIGMQKIDVNTAVAVFYTSAGSKPFVDGGTVSCEGKALTKDTSNAYYYNPSGTDVITFSGTTEWAISGNAANGMPLVNFSSAAPIPTYNGVFNGSLTSTVNRASDLNIALNGAVTGADSVMVSVSNGSSVVQKIVAASTNCTFTAAQLSALTSSNGNATGIIQVAPFKIDFTINSGKKYYFVNQASYTKLVTID